MPRDDDAAATLPTAPLGGVLATRPMLVATIAHHPDARRIGERATLGPAESTRAALSRHAPEFVPLYGTGGAPLDDRSVSRHACELTNDKSALRIAANGAKVAVDGDQVADGWQGALGRGRVVRLGRVLLWLHVTTTVRPRSSVDHGLIGVSECLERVRDDIDAVARHNVAILVRGESGVGKELVARAVHAASSRRAGPFVALNMAALPAGTAAAELFGHARGGYTGAVGEHHGAFGAAAGGTLFLDEIGAADANVQAMLLRALETSEIRQVGGRENHVVDVRVVAATDEDLEASMGRGAFRVPLYHRLAGYVVHVPPLRERREDIAPLLHAFARAAGAPLDAEGAEPWLPATLVERILLHPWPGNVRELRNAVQQIVLASRQRPLAVLPPALERELARSRDRAAGGSEPRSTRGRGLDAISDDELVAALRANHWEPASAARALGIAKASIYQLMERCDRVRAAKDIGQAEILAVRAATGGDVRRMAEELMVSKRALRRRMTELGID
jgi:two-component system nitrogen regulation response regulator GlnG